MCVIWALGSHMSGSLGAVGVHTVGRHDQFTHVHVLLPNPWMYVCVYSNDFTWGGQTKPNQTFVFEDMWFRQDLLTTLFILCICTACSTTWTVALKQLCGTKGQRKLTHQNISKCQWNFSNNTARTLCNWQYRWLTNKRKTQGLSKVLGRLRVPWQIFVMSPAEIPKKIHPE